MTCLHHFLWSGLSWSPPTRRMKRGTSGSCGHLPWIPIILLCGFVSIMHKLTALKLRSMPKLPAISKNLAKQPTHRWSQTVRAPWPGLIHVSHGHRMVLWNNDHLPHSIFQKVAGFMNTLVLACLARYDTAVLGLNTKVPATSPLPCQYNFKLCI